MSTLTAEAAHAPGLSSTLRRNISALEERRALETSNAALHERVADRITCFAGSMTFVCVHAVVYGLWILANTVGLPSVPRFDPSLVILAMEASVEAIFLSTFVLISQNRMAATARKQSELDLQISLLAEHEITKVVQIVSRIAEHLDIRIDREVEELERDVAPETVLDELDDPRRRRPDISRARQLLGWTPRVALPEGLAATVAWFAAEMAVEASLMPAALQLAELPRPCPPTPIAAAK